MKYLGLAIVLLVVGSAFKASTSSSKVEHGDYLANRASICVNCHTPRDAKGNPDMSKSLEGAQLGTPAEGKEPTIAPNITSTGYAGRWGEKGMVNFLMTGKTPSGGMADPPMPQYRFNKNDAESLYAYMMSLPLKK